jgi:GTP pyrophosphokinase
MGDVKDLPKGATPVDFAYSIHSDMGDTCGGAIVNGKMTTLDRKLENGDIIEIIKRKSAKPRPDWLKFVKTQSARSKIKRAIDS